MAPRIALSHEILVTTTTLEISRKSPGIKIRKNTRRSTNDKFAIAMVRNRPKRLGFHSAKALRRPISNCAIESIKDSVFKGKYKRSLRLTDTKITSSDSNPESATRNQFYRSVCSITAADDTCTESVFQSTRVCSSITLQVCY